MHGSLILTGPGAFRLDGIRPSPSSMRYPCKRAAPCAGGLVGGVNGFDADLFDGKVPGSAEMGDGGEEREGSVRTVVVQA